MVLSCLNCNIELHLSCPSCFIPIGDRAESHEDKTGHELLALRWVRLYSHVRLFSCVWNTFWTEHALIFQYRGYGGTSEWFNLTALYSTRLSLYANTNCFISPAGHFDRLSFKMNHYQNRSISASAAASYNITCGSEICGPPSKLLAYFALTPSRWLVYRVTCGFHAAPYGGGETEGCC